MDPVTKNNEILTIRYHSRNKMSDPGTPVDDIMRNRFLEVCCYMTLILFLIIIPSYVILTISGKSIQDILLNENFIRIWFVSIPVSYFLFGLLYPYFNGYIHIENNTIKFRDGVIFRKLYSPMINLNILDIKTIIRRKQDSMVVFETTNNKREVLDISGIQKEQLTQTLECLSNINNKIKLKEE